MFKIALHRRVCLLVLWAIACLAALPAQAAVKSQRPGAAVTVASGSPVANPEPVSRLIIRYREELKADVFGKGVPGAERAQAQALVARSAERAGALPLHFLKSVSRRMQVAVLEQPVSADQAKELIKRLQADPSVASVTVDQRLRSYATPTDTYFTDAGSPYYQWHLQSASNAPGGINAGVAWAISTGDGATVAVLDGGYRPHADLAANLLTLTDYDFISADADSIFWTANDGDARDDNAEDPGDWVTATEARAYNCDASNSSWHGTHVAGLIGALSNSTEGVGVAYGAKILPVRVLGRCGGYLSDVLAGMRWAAGLSLANVSDTTTPAKVLNLSLGASGACDPVTQAVIDEVRARGVSIVASSGNAGLTAISKPANCMGVVAVTAHTRSGANAGYANVGTGVAISAPGGDSADPVASTWNLGVTVPGADTYGRMYGTSMAAPQAVGVLALMAATRTDLALATQEALMRGAVRPFPEGTYCAVNPDNLPPGFCGSGLLDAGLAVDAAQAVLPGLADLEVLQRATASSWAADSVVDLRIHLRNWGAVPATAVQLSATFAGLEIRSVTSSLVGVDPTHSSTGLSATVGNLGAGAELVLTVSARVTASDTVVSSSAQASGSGAEATLVNNNHRLDPAGFALEPTPSPSIPPPDIPPPGTVTDGGGGGGGGCTAAPAGQADASLLLLALLSLGLAVLRRRGR